MGLQQLINVTVVVQMRSKKDFFFEDVYKPKGGRPETVNVVQGLELHKGLLNAQEQACVVSAIESWVEAGRAVSVQLSFLNLNKRPFKIHGKLPDLAPRRAAN